MIPKNNEEEELNQLRQIVCILRGLNLKVTRISVTWHSHDSNPQGAKEIRHDIDISLSV